MADYFQWSPERYGVGVAAMDREHEALVGAMNRLHGLVRSGAPTADVGAAMDALLRLTREHFADEEALMASLEYPELASHRLVHRSLLERLGGYRDALGRDGRIGEDFFHFLRSWLKAHMADMDRKYGERTPG